MITKQQFFDITDRYGFPASKFVRDASDNSDALVEHENRPLFVWKLNEGITEASYLDWKANKMVSVSTNYQFEELVSKVKLKIKKEFTTKQIKNIQEDF